PITAEQLQAEMDRMAKNTRQPEVLDELFHALRDDPFVIAECLARPALADRLLTSWYAYDQRIHGELKHSAEAELLAHPAVEGIKQLSGKYSETELVKGENPKEEAHHGGEYRVKLNSREWEQILQKVAITFESDNVKAGVFSSLEEDEERYYVMAVLSKTNDRLRLATVSWLKEPLDSWLARAEHRMPTAMMAQNGNYTLPAISDGVGCIDDTWTPTPGSPEPRSNHTAVWTGSEMIIWGGSSFDRFNTGGRYNPATDSWTVTSTTRAPTPRSSHTAVWTGSEMIVWGGSGEFGSLNTGGRYNPTTNSWTATSTSNAPDARYYHTAVWTGAEMIVWGGFTSPDY